MKTRKHNPSISLVIPAHNEQDNLQWHHDVIAQFMESKGYPYTIIYVDDGSTDATLAVMRKLHTDNPSTTRYLSLSRNFGKEAATSAGLSKADNDVTVIIDADGQHPIEYVETFVDLWKEGNDVVIGLRKENVGKSVVKNLGSALFHVVLRVVNGKHSPTPGSTDFRLLDKRVVKEFNQLTERNRITRNLIDWLGFKQAIVPFSANERHAGVPTYSLKKLTKLALNSVVAHSTRPLKLIGVLGFFVATLSVGAAIFLTIQQYILGDPLELAVTGVAILALFVSFLIGVVLICQGLLALYIESVYYETQNRPLFIIAEESESIR